MLLLIILVIYVVPILDAISNWEALNENVAQKISDLSSLLQGGSASGEGAENRQIRYQKSWEAFLEHPLFGSRWLGISNDGGHSFLLDTLARWGIVGLGFMILFWIFIIKNYKKIVQDSAAKHFCVLKQAQDIYLHYEFSNCRFQLVQLLENAEL